MGIRVVIVEDQGIVRELLAALLGREPHISVVGEASTGALGLELAARLAPDVLLLDISLPDMDGIAVARAVREKHPKIHIIALSIHDEPRTVEAMLEAGAEGYVSKSTTVDDLREAIRAVTQGRLYVSPVLRFDAREKARAAAAGGLARREREVLALLAEGRRSAEIAKRLGISTATVDVHRRNIMRKLDLHSVAELTKYALRHGLTSL